MGSSAPHYAKTCSTTSTKIPCHFHPSSAGATPRPDASVTPLEHVVRDVLIDHKGDHGGGHDAEQVGRQALVEAAQALSPVGAPNTVQTPRVL